MSPLISNHKISKKDKNEIILESKKLGFDAIGFAKPDLKSEAKGNLNDFLENNYHGEMAVSYTHLTLPTILLV